jgi:glucose/arabinose dehydrogenase
MKSMYGPVLVAALSFGCASVPYEKGQTRITATPVRVADLPAGPLSHHWTKNVIASRDGSRLYVSVGSNSNVAEHGLDKEAGRAAIWEIWRVTALPRSGSSS